MLLAIWTGLLYNNKRLDDFKDLLKAEVGKAKAELQTEIATAKAELQSGIASSKAELRAEIEASKAEGLRSEQRILQAIAEMKAELKADIHTLDQRLQRLEAPLLRT